jgi:hypothetical protein
MKQWFDHYVKEMSAADWMTDGIPYLDKQYNKAQD